MSARVTQHSIQLKNEACISYTPVHLPSSWNFVASCIQLINKSTLCSATFRTFSQKIHGYELMETHKPRTSRKETSLSQWFHSAYILMGFYWAQLKTEVWPLSLFLLTVDTLLEWKISINIKKTSTFFSSSVFDILVKSVIWNTV